MVHTTSDYLRKAAKKGDIEGIKTVFEEIEQIDPNIDINSRDSNGRTALMLAALSGHYDCVELLLSYPLIDPNVRGLLSEVFF